jgi:hypothetical protein
MSDSNHGRWDCPGIACIGDEVIWDGEAEYLGLPPLKKKPEPDALKDVDYPDTEDLE